MRIAHSPTVRIATGLLLVVLLSVVGYQAFRRSSVNSPEALLQRADDLAWNGQWFAAAPIFHQADIKYTAERNEAKALYAQVSQIPTYGESASLADTIYALTQDLKKPGADDPETRLRILEVRGMIENNYDASLARQTWSQVAVLARDGGHFLLGSGALREEGLLHSLLVTRSP